MKTRPNESAMAALRALGARLDGPIVLFDSLDDVLFWIKDRDGRFRWANTMMALYYGFKIREDLIGLNDYDLFDATLAQQYLNDDEQVLHEHEIRKPHKNYGFLFDPAKRTEFLDAVSKLVDEAEFQLVAAVIVAKKFRRSPAGETKGWGLKVFP